MKQQVRLPEDARSIVVVRALRGIGDMLVVVPALRALRAHYPRAHIALLGLPWTEEIFRRTGPYIDEVIEFAGWPGIVDTPCDTARIPSFLAEIQSRRFDVALQMHGSGTASNGLTTLLGAEVCAGYYLPSTYRPEGHFVPYRALPEPVLWVELLEKLGVEPRGYDLELRMLEADVQAAREVLEGAGAVHGEYAVVHPGADNDVRRWDERYFSEVARHLSARGLRVLVTGAAPERELADAIVARGNSAVTSIAGRTSLGALAALVDGAALVVANDTGISHLAAALRTPSVIVYTPASERVRWQPLDRSLHRAVSPPSLRAVLAEADDLLGLRVTGGQREAVRYAM